MPSDTDNPAAGTTSRRDFLRLTAGLTFCFGFPAALPAALAAAEPDGDRQINAYVNIAPDGTVTIYSPSAEMGQGTLSSLPLIVAEELDADWSRCRVLPSPPLGDVYGDPVFLNMIYTVASRSVAVYFDRLRLFGARARRVLMMNAAEHWGVPLAELQTEPGRVVHGASGRRLGYGEIAVFAEIPPELPEIDPSELKSPAEFRLIGKVAERRDMAGKVDGSLEFSIDVRLPDMVYAAVVRPPIPGANILAVDERGARDMPGVIDILRQDQQVAVVARSWFEALNARDRVEVRWDRVGAVNDYDSERAMEGNVAAARDLSRDGFAWDSGGDAAAALNAAAEVFEREYRSDFMYHAGIEPLNAVVRVRNGTAEVWAGTQAPPYTVETVAQMAGVAPDKVTLHRSLMGGAFGRRSVFGMDFVADAAWIARRIERPVKVVWSREDDFRYGHFRPMTAQLLRAGIGDDGTVRGWQHRVACEDPLKRFEPPLYEAWGGIPLIAMEGSGHAAMDGSPWPYAYDLPDRVAEYVAVETGLRIYAMRGVGALPNRFAIEAFIDELAERFGVDPLAYRLGLLHRSDRARAVVKTVADMAGWGRPRDGRGLGLAYSHHADSMVACVVEASVDAKQGRLRAHKVWLAADVGIAIQPGNVVDQLEGGVLFGLSNAMMERITIRDGVVQQRNFNEYDIMRMDDAPSVEVRLLHNAAHPTGVGETGTVVAPAALANAFAAVTGRRLRHLPFTPDRVREALK